MKRIAIGAALVAVVAIVLLFGWRFRSFEPSSLQADPTVGTRVECVQKAYVTSNPSAGNKAMEQVLAHYRGWRLVLHTVTARMPAHTYILLCFSTN